MKSSVFGQLHVPIVAVLRAANADSFMRVAEVLIDSGIEAIEVTMTSSGALDVITQLRARHPTALLGVGTIRTTSQMADSVNAGADFLVSPNLDFALIEAANSIPYIPGALTPTEIAAAASRGAGIVKVSPVGPIGGPEYIRELSGPLPEVELFPTGGVLPSLVTEYLSAGASIVGVSRDFLQDAVEIGGDLQGLRLRTIKLVEMVEEFNMIRKGSE